MKLITALMLAGTFLIAQPVFAGTEAAPPAAEKAPKAKKDKADKGAGDKGAGGDKKEEPKKEEKKAEKGGW